MGMHFTTDLSYHPVILHFQENDYVTKLDLSSNLIGEVGAGYLGRAVAINNTLDSVDLSENCIRQTGAVLIGKSVIVSLCF